MKRREVVDPSPLPALHARWMGEFLAGRIPGEPQATCNDCAMCQPASGRDASAPAEARSDAVFYDPAVKCCSYTPILWNFLTGELLADTSPEAAEGRGTVERRMASGVAVTPLGLGRPRAYSALYQHIAGAFGRTRAMRCPHFIEDGGRCGVWRHRESTCATWFCKHERGAIGKTFWNRLHQLLRTAEEGVARWCTLELGVEAQALGTLFPLPGAPQPNLPVTGHDFDDVVNPALYRAQWGNWINREAEFYRAAADLVRPLSWSRVATIGGSELAVYAALARDSYQALTSGELPAHLQSTPIQLVAQDMDHYQVSTYSQLDPLQLPVELIGVLHYFDGRPTKQALETIESETGLRLTPDLVRRLADFGILAAT